MKTAGKGIEVTKIIDAFGYVIYGTLAMLAIWGVYNSVLLYRNLGKKGLKNQDAADLINQVRDLTSKGNFQGAIDVCSGPHCTGIRRWPSSSPWPCGSATRGSPRSARCS